MELCAYSNSMATSSCVTVRCGASWVLTGRRWAASLIDDEYGLAWKWSRESADQLKVGRRYFERVSEKPPDDIPSRWKGLIGEYGWDHNTLYILEDQGKLFALIEWFYYYPLEELDMNTFAFPDYGLYHGEGLQFTRDDEGTATHVVAAEVKFRSSGGRHRAMERHSRFSLSNRSKSFAATRWPRRRRRNRESFGQSESRGPDVA